LLDLKGVLDGQNGKYIDNSEEALLDDVLKNKKPEKGVPFLRNLK